MQPRMVVLLSSSIALVLVLTGCGGGDVVEVPPLPTGRSIATSTSAAPTTTSATAPTSEVEEYEPPPVAVPEPPSEQPAADQNGYVEADRYRWDFEDSVRYRFKSPTGALSCEIFIPVYELDESNTRTICDIHGRKGAGPDDPYCNDGNVTGAVLYTSYTAYSCGPTAAGSSYNVLGYGQKIRVALFECLSERTGITCIFSNHPSIKVAREGVVLT